jgi:DNA-binding MarR family transcriptional regulator
MAKPLNIVDCASFNLRKASRMMAQAYDRYLQPSGLTNTQFTLLAVISGRGPISITELAGVLGMDRTTLTRNLRLVERHGLLEVTAGKDARTRDVRLTANGHEALKKAIPLWQDAQSRVVEAFGRAHWRELVKELRAISQVARSLD